MTLQFEIFNLQIKKTHFINVYFIIYQTKNFYRYFQQIQIQKSQMGRNKRNNHKNSRAQNNTKQNNQNNHYPKASQQQLQIECLQLYQKVSNKTKILKQQKLDYCYIVSTKWLEDWKQYVGYYNLQQSDQKKHKKIGKKHPGKINHELVIQNKNFYYIPIEQYQYMNTVISEKKQKDDDYIAIAKQIWDLFAARYDHTEIKRPKRVNKKGSVFYDGGLLQIQVIIVNFKDKQLIEKIQSTKNMPKRDLDQQFPCDKMQLSTLWQLHNLTNFVQQYSQSVYQECKCKIWKVQGYATVGQVQRTLWQGINNQSDKIKVPCRQMNQKQQKYKDLDLDDFLKSYHSLVIQIGSSRLQNAQVPDLLEGYCQQCVKKKPLTFSCSCEQVFYCSEQCRIVDQIFHQNICKAAFDSEDDEQYQKKKLTYNDKVLYPIIGLNNLGNTCYMNSVLQSLISIESVTQYFAGNRFETQIDPKQYEQNRGRLLKKYSKFLKLISQKKQSLSPWSLKGQINYFLSPFKGFKQHDANDFLVNFINAINQQLKKQGEAYHKIFSQNFLGEFNSLIKCPDCMIQLSNDQIFTQITLPIKQRVKSQTTNYVIYQNAYKIVHGKCILESWQQMRRKLGLKSTCLLMATRQGQFTIDVDEEQDVQKTVKKLKRDLIYYPNCTYEDNDQFFSFIPITQKFMYGQQMKSPYGYPAIINVDPQLNTLGSFWVRILKHFYQSSVYQQAIKIKQKYFIQIQKCVSFKKSQSQNTQSTQQKQCKKQQDQQVQLTKKIEQEANNALKQLLAKNKISVFVNDIKKSRNICAFCKKKCSGCELPVLFSLQLKEYLEGKSKQVTFQILLKEKIQQEKIQKDIAKSGQPTLHDCMQLFTQPQQLDQQNAWWCQACQNLRLAYKQLTIKKLPKILIIHLNRFKTEGQKKVKNSQQIQYQQVQQFCGTKYKLLSVIVHEGSTEGGHYWSICRRNDKYYIFNDNKVSQTQKICNKNAYILTYKKIQ